MATGPTVTTRSFLLAAAAICLAPFAAHATGGGEFDQPARTLGETLDCLPGKSLGEIFLETTPELKDAGKAPDFEGELNAIADRLRTEPPAALIKKVDELLAQARRHYSTAKFWCNLLHDVRDLLAGSASDRAAAADYLKWRVAHREYFGFPPEKKNREGDEKTPSAPAGAAAELEEKAQTAKDGLRAHWLFLSGALTYVQGDRDKCRPWFERVVKEFPKHPRAEAAQFLLARCSFFDSRRGRDDDSSGNTEEERKRAKLRLDAQVLFERFRKAYPNGRFDADALGWLGALAFDGGDYLKALEFYSAQAETPGHPETLKSALFMCEKCLVLIAAKPDAPAAYALVARHPRIAMGFAYLVLSAPEADNYNGEYDQPAAVKKWRRTVLPKIAAAVAQQKDLYKNGDWQPRYLALLAQAASTAGNPTEALQLTNLAPDQLEKSDDLLLVRAIAFERAKKPSDAIVTYRKLLKNFPDRPFAQGARLRLALALQDNHQAGDALVELVQLLKTNATTESKPAASPTPSASPAADDEQETDDEDNVKEEPPPVVTPSELEAPRFVSGTNYPDSLREWDVQTSAIYPNITGADLEQVEEAIDTLLNFAPLPELAMVVTSDRLVEAARRELRRVIAQRYLAQENFSEAQKFLDATETKSLAANLEKLTVAANSASGDKADQMLQLANAWADARGKLLRAPLDTNAGAANVTSNYIHLDQPADTPIALLQVNPALTLAHRRENARSIGMKNPDAELSERDELRHASRWWMNAARARPSSPVAAEARWKALEAMPKLARASDYAEQLAREINGEAVSREIYQRLRKESPNSKEATRLAAYWSFPAADETSSNSSSEDTDLRDPNMMGYPVDDFEAFAPDRNDSSADGQDVTADWNDIEKRVAALRDHLHEGDIATMGRVVRELQATVQKAIATVGDDYWINLLDDLAQFFSEPNLTPKMQQTYVNIRLDVLHRTNLSERTPPPISTKEDTDEAVAAEIAEAQQDPANKPIADYLDMCLLALKAGARVQVETDIPDAKETDSHATYGSRDYAGMEKMARDFLAKYPRSKKREPALFVVARSVHALSRPYFAFVGVPLTGADPKLALIEIQQKSYEREPLNPKRVLGALDDYDREFPKGRYAAEVRNLRAMTLWRTHDWPAALDLTLAQFSDATKPELRPEAAIRLANIFAALEDPQSRADLLEAIRARPAALPLLKKFVDASSGHRTHPLRYLVSYLTDQLNLKAVASQ